MGNRHDYHTVLNTRVNLLTLDWLFRFRTGGSDNNRWGFTLLAPKGYSYLCYGFTDIINNCDEKSCMFFLLLGIDLESNL